MRAQTKASCCCRWWPLSAHSTDVNQGAVVIRCAHVLELPGPPELPWPRQTSCRFACATPRAPTNPPESVRRASASFLRPLSAIISRGSWLSSRTNQGRTHNRLLPQPSGRRARHRDSETQSTAPYPFTPCSIRLGGTGAPRSSLENPSTPCADMAAEVLVAHTGQRLLIDASQLASCASLPLAC